ncbi:MAG: acyl-CoA thioesterase [Hyphomicrobiaceae bacterium]
MFKTEIGVEWGDCDEAGIVYYPRYFDWFDRTFQRFLKAKGMTQRSLRSEFGVMGTPLVEASCTFKGPVTYDTTVTIGVAVDRWEEKRFTLAYTVFLDGRVVAEGGETRAWVARQDHGKLKALPIPAEFRNRMGGASCEG